MEYGSSDHAAAHECENDPPAGLALEPLQGHSTKSIDNGWTIQAAQRRRRHGSQQATCCFIVGPSEGVTDDDLISNASAHGVTILKCFILPPHPAWPDARAMKVFITRGTTDRTLLKGFWPDGVWCREWQGRSNGSRVLSDSV